MRRQSTTCASLRRLSGGGVPIVGFEPSCVSMVRDTYPGLVGGGDARLVAGAIVTFEEFVAAESKARRFTLRASRGPERILVHGHCHQKAMNAVGPPSRRWR